MVELAWIIPLLPILAFVLILVAGERGPLRGAGFGIASVLAALGCSLAVAVEVLLGEHGPAAARPVELPWIALGVTHLNFGVLVDPLTAVMLIVITVVASMVQIYSLGYMHGDARFPLYYAYLCLFTAAMLGLVLASNLVLLYVCWEIMGLTSYLLIGFWFEKPSAMRAAKKAFIVTRLGDVAFFFGIAWLIWRSGTADLGQLVLGPSGAGPVDAGPALAALAGTPVLTWIAICLFGGAVGKSAQFPLHVWLPDAMEGPTPVSALIHAATMVAAGVYLVARMFPVFAAGAPVPFLGIETTALGLVATIGCITALLAALIALTQDDIKRVLAFSTISQLGYMMMGLGVGSFFAGTFHLTTHAFFKSLLFLGAGSVIHGTGTQDLWEMGGLKRPMRHTFVTFLIGYLALAGVFPLAGFWSKDAILDAALHHHQPLVFAAGLAGAFLTALYMTRLMVLAFAGSWRGPAPANGMHDATHPVAAGVSSGSDGHDAHGHPGGDGHAHGHGDHDHGHVGPHESPPSMTVPLYVLAALSCVVGFVGTPFANWFGHRLLFAGESEHSAVNYLAMVFSTLTALAGIGLGVFLYPEGRFRLAHLKGSGAGMLLYRLSKERFYFDEFYWKSLVEPLFVATRSSYWVDQRIVDALVNGAGSVTVLLSKVHRLFDVYIVDGIVNLVGWTTKRSGYLLRYAQSGLVQRYVMALFVGAILLMWLFLKM
jgi:NADH-quinone oxidoreductase subunit L